mgnify:CR=1 FL=1
MGHSADVCAHSAGPRLPPPLLESCSKLEPPSVMVDDEFVTPRPFVLRPATSRSGALAVSPSTSMSVFVACGTTSDDPLICGLLRCCQEPPPKKRATTVNRGLRENRTQEGTWRFYRFHLAATRRTRRFYRVSPFLSTTRHRKVTEISVPTEPGQGGRHNLGQGKYGN